MDHGKIKIIKSQREGNLLFYRGFCYNIVRENENISTWRCRDRKCKGSIVLEGENCRIKNQNTHDVDFEKNEYENLKHMCKERSLITDERPRDIVLNEIGIVTTSVSKYLPKHQNLYDSITKL
ncbi:hypothetical protein DMUE_2058 [Dictyocoela muelleri]|nr:hypothetical protein DMUE_2058 [Dictyocoela muelleri]